MPCAGSCSEFTSLNPMCQGIFPGHSCPKGSCVRSQAGWEDPSGKRLAHGVGEQALMAPLLQVLLEMLEAGFPYRMSCQMSFSALFPVSPLHHITRHIHSGVTAPSNQRSRAFAASLAGGAVPGSLHGVCSLISRFWGNSSSTKSAHSFPNV